MVEKNEYPVLDLFESFKDDNEYNSSKCLSYSKIKNAYYDPKSLFEEKDEEEKEWLTFGTLVDLMINPNVILEDKVLVNNIVPSDQFKKAAEYMVENNLVDPLLLTNDQVEEVYVNSGSKVNWTSDVKRKKLYEGCGNYIELLTKHKDKLIVSTEMYNEAFNISQTLMTHKWTKELFLNKENQKSNCIDLYYQFKIKYNLRGFLCKSKIDLIKVDHDTLLISPYDIKTGSDFPNTFINYSIYKYKYIYQSVMYKEGLEAFIKKLPGFENYEVEPFRFVYISRLCPDYPIIVQLSDSFHKEILYQGIEDGLRDIPSLSEVFDAITHYYKVIDAGNVPKEPYYLQGTWGEIVVSSSCSIF
jgi:hypothetical protein